MKGIALNSFASYTASLLSVATTLVLARHIGPESYAAVALSIALGSICQHLFNLGSQRTFIREALALPEASILRFAVHGLLFRISIGTFLVSCVYLVLWNFSNTLQTHTVAILIMSTWISLLGLYPTGWFDLRSKTLIQNSLVACERASNLVLLTTYMLLAENEINLISIASIFLTMRVLSISLQIDIWRRMEREHQDQKPGTSKTINIQASQEVSVKVTIAMLANSIMTFGNQILLAEAGTPNELSSYSIAFQIIGMVMLMQGQIMRLLNKNISRSARETRSLNAKIRESCTTMIACSSTLVTIAFLTSYFLLPLVLPQDGYAQAPSFVALLGVWIIIAGIGKVITQYLIELRLERNYLWITLVGASLASVLGYWLIPIHGAFAVAGILFAVHTLQIIANIQCLRIYLVKP